VSFDLAIRQQAKDFLEALGGRLKQEAIAVEPNWDVDHLCYRVSTLQNYESLKKEFSNFSELLIESDVNGRPIATFKLHKPILFDEWRIDLIELPAPKAGKKTIEGFEHIEVVADISFNEFKKRFSHLKLDESGLKKKFNKELEISLGERNIKFHSLSLESVVRLEGQTLIWSAIQKSRVLDILQSFDPLLAGTFPLGLAVEHSDIDVILNVKNHNEFAALARSEWGSLEDFNLKNKVVDELPTTLVKFSIDGILFELFAQEKESVKQNAYLHFLAEERLLKLGGPSLKTKVKELRAKGMKTEEAFARALGLNEDPYMELLKVQKYSNQQMSQLV